MYSPNLKSVALPVNEIRGLQSRGRGGHRGSGMVPGGRGWYRPKERWEFL